MSALHGIDRAAPVIIDDGEQTAGAWGAFIDANADAIEAGDVDPTAIAKDLLKRPGCTAFGGGGASAGWSIRLLVGFDGEGGGMSPPRTRQEANEIDEEADDDTLFP